MPTIRVTYSKFSQSYTTLAALLDLGPERPCQQQDPYKTANWDLHKPN